MKIYFVINVLFAILFSNTISKTIYSGKTAVDENSINLNNFMNLLHNAHSDLKWIRDTNQLYRGQKSDANWVVSPDIVLGDSRNSGDIWYRQFHNDELKLDMIKNLPSPEPEQKPIETNLQDQSETTKNDLSHEANYKLSKFEQELEEKNRVEKEKNDKILHPPLADGLLAKRKIDPNEEIRLKIRSRLADKFETFVERHMNAANITGGEDYCEYMKTHRKIPNYNLFKRETPDNGREFTKRKLLQNNGNDDDDDDNKREVDSPSYVDRVKLYNKNYFGNRNKRQKNKINEMAANDMITGVLPNKLVKAIFTLAEKNENFGKFIAPNIKIKSFVEIKKADAQDQSAKISLSKKTDDVMGKIIKSITQLVDDQIKTRSCIPIKPELLQFAKKLVSISKNAKLVSAKFEFPILNKNQEQNLAIDEEVDSNRYVRSAAGIIDSGIIHDKYTTITNLQNSFNKLAANDQIRYNTMKQFIDKHLPLLDELSELSHRNDQLVKNDPNLQHQLMKRDIFLNSFDDEFNSDLNTMEMKQPFNDQLTERFIKLSKMVEFMRQNSLFDTTDYDLIGNDFIL